MGLLEYLSPCPQVKQCNKYIIRVQTKLHIKITEISGGKNLILELTIMAGEKKESLGLDYLLMVNRKQLNVGSALL